MPQGTHGLAVAALVFVAGLAGCAPAAMARTARVAPSGKLASNVSMSLNWAFWDITDKGQRGRGLSGPRSDGDLRMIGSWLASFEVVLRVGISAHCEAAGLLGVARVGGELRCGVSDGDTALAVSGAVALSLHGRRGPWLRGAIEASYRAGDGEPFAGLFLSYGRHNREVSSNRRWRVFNRSELRLTGSVGAAAWSLRNDDVDGAITLGVMPHRVLWAGPAELFGCLDCAPVASANAVEHAGIGLAVGAESMAR